MKNFPSPKIFKGKKEKRKKVLFLSETKKKVKIIFFLFFSSWSFGRPFWMTRMTSRPQNTAENSGNSTKVIRYSI